MTPPIRLSEVAEKRESKCPLCGWKLDADPGLLTWCDQTDDSGPVEVVSVAVDAYVA